MPHPQPLSTMFGAESDLVQACKDGNLSAYEQLFRAHSTRMKSIALNLLGNIADAEDAVQEAFLKIYRSVGNFKGKSAFSTWIYRILINACNDLRRKHRRRYEPLEVATNPGGVELPAAQSSDHPLRLTLEKHLAELPLRNRSVFVLFEVEGFKHREIAEILSIPEGTSKNLLFETKRELQRRLSQNCDDARKNLQ